MILRSVRADYPTCSISIGHTRTFWGQKRLLERLKKDPCYNTASLIMWTLESRKSTLWEWIYGQPKNQ